MSERELEQFFRVYTQQLESKMDVDTAWRNRETLIGAEPSFAEKFWELKGEASDATLRDRALAQGLDPARAVEAERRRRELKAARELEKRQRNSVRTGFGFVDERSMWQRARDAPKEALRSVKAAAKARVDAAVERARKLKERRVWGNLQDAYAAGRASASSVVMGTLGALTSVWTAEPTTSFADPFVALVAGAANGFRLVMVIAGFVLLTAYVLGWTEVLFRHVLNFFAVVGLETTKDAGRMGPT